jgi:hypothetical protein
MIQDHLASPEGDVESSDDHAAQAALMTALLIAPCLVGYAETTATQASNRLYRPAARHSMGRMVEQELGRLVQ